MSNETIKTLRIQAGLSQNQLAARAGVTKSAVSQWETGRAGLTGRNLLKVAEALCVDPKAILGEALHSDELRPEEQRCLELFRTLGARERNAVLAFLSALAGSK